MAKCNSLYIDVTGLMAAIREACKNVLNSVAKQVIAEFQVEIEANGRGKPAWRSSAASEFQKIEEDMSGDILKVVLGLRKGLEQEAQGMSNMYAARVMVALFGNHPPIETKPNLKVFNDDMTGTRNSPALTVYPLPGLGQTDPDAQKMVENALQKAQVAFDEACESILNGINIANYVHVG